MVRVLYHRNRDINDILLASGSSISRTSYYRILALASIDILFTLPFSITFLVMVVITGLTQNSLPFYPGWEIVHSDWAPKAYSYAETSLSISTLAEFYVSYWTSPILSLTIFALLGLTSDARASYWSIASTFSSWFRWKRLQRSACATSELAATKPDAHPQEIVVSLDAELGYVVVLFTMYF